MSNLASLSFRDSIVQAAVLVKIPSVDEAWTLCGCAIGGSMEEWNMKREKRSKGFPRRNNPRPALKARCVQVSVPQEPFSKLSQNHLKAKVYEVVCLAKFQNCLVQVVLFLYPRRELPRRELEFNSTSQIQQTVMTHVYWRFKEPAQILSIAFFLTIGIRIGTQVLSLSIIKSSQRRRLCPCCSEPTHDVYSCLIQSLHMMYIPDHGEIVDIQGAVKKRSKEEPVVLGTAVEVMHSWFQDSVLLTSKLGPSLIFSGSSLRRDTWKSLYQKLVVPTPFEDGKESEERGIHQTSQEKRSEMLVCASYGVHPCSTKHLEKHDDLLKESYNTLSLELQKLMAIYLAHVFVSCCIARGTQEVISVHHQTKTKKKALLMCSEPTQYLELSLKEAGRL
ncbi:hypothetical protein F2Q69_00051237 [Brassica cretica]|uniref:Uncharacterized protein n=1 Tax=Brassica cretica TaxID=69181 RepID=A0A8S9PWX3_BRACR|nr:hypothetical protein F2Q69_00051237 [Brassica cretica]